LGEAFHLLFDIMFRRLSNLIRGFFGLFISGLEKKNPEALLEVEKERLREQISKYNKGLAAHAALCERIMTQVKKLEKLSGDLRAKAAANLKVGNKRAAAQFALRLKTIEGELDENNIQLKGAEDTYTELLNARDVSIKAARAQIEDLRRDIDDMKVQKAMAELNEMASGMIGEIGGSGDTLNRLHEMVEDEASKARGRSRVAKDMIDTTEVQVIQAEQEALEDQALADFAAAEGFTLEGESLGGEAGEKTMGASATEA